MKQTQIHAIVLGCGLLLASMILLVRVSHASRSSEEDDAAAALSTAKSPVSKAAPVNVVSDGDKALHDAEDLVKEAKDLLQLGRGEGHEGELIQAKKLLHRAQDLIEPLSRDDPKVKSLSARLSEAMDDAVRISGF